MSSATQQLQFKYEAIFNKTVPARMKNNARWLRSKLSEHENEKGIMIANKVVDTLEKKRVTPPNLDFNVRECPFSQTPPTAKKQKLEKKVDGLSDLLNKIPYEYWIQFDKLLTFASDEEKAAFVKKAKGEVGGKLNFYCISKTEERLKEAEARVNEEKKHLNGLFVSEALQTKIGKVIQTVTELYHNPDKPDDDFIKKELMPMVLEQISKYLMADSYAMKSRIILEKIRPLVSQMDAAELNDKQSVLRRSIEKLKEDISKCPDGERFETVKNEMKSELRTKEKELLTLTSGSEEAWGLDILDGASQLD